MDIEQNLLSDTKVYLLGMRGQEAALPRLYDRYPACDKLVCSKVEMKQYGDTVYQLVTVTYERPDMAGL